jgi:hypothetical protein
MQNFKNHSRPLSIAIALLAALVLAACGEEDSGSSAIDIGDGPATLVPADAPIYGEAVVKPEGDLEENVSSALSKLLGVDDPGAMITDAIDSELSGEEAGVTWDEVDAWLGSRVGGFITDFSSESGEGAAVIEVTDPEAAQATLDKLESSGDSGDLSEAEYEGITYKSDASDGGAYGFVEDFLVLGTEQGFKDAVDASAGESLADDEAAAEALESTSEGSLFSAVVDAGAVIDQLVESGEIREQDLGPYKKQLDQLGDEPVVIAGGAEEDAFFFESSAPATEEAMVTDIVSTLPSDAWLAFGAPDVGKTLQLSLDSFLSSLDSYSVQAPGLEAQGNLPDIPKEIEKQTGFDIEQDLDLEWIGDVGGFVQGSSIFGLGGGLVIETDDEDAASAAIDDLAKMLSRERSIGLRETPEGFEIQVQGAPVGAEVALRDGKVVLAAAGATVDEVLSPGETLDSNDRFGTASEALGEDLTPIMFVDFPTILDLVESTGQATSDPEYQAAQQCLGAIDFMVAGASSDGDRAISRFVLGVRESESSSGSAAMLVP